MFRFVEEENKTCIKVIGLGGAGGNIINAMASRNPCGLELIAANTDLQDLERSLASNIIQLGPICTKGLGTGLSIDIGKKAAEESVEEIKEVLEGADLVFIVAGLGGGTGSGSAPFVAEICKSLGALTVAMVTQPFSFEIGEILENAEIGFNELTKSTDTVVPISNSLFVSLHDDTSFQACLNFSNYSIGDAVRGVADLINTPGFINLDFADIRAVMSLGGITHIGRGSGTGNDRARDALSSALTSPILHYKQIHGAKGILVSLSAKSASLNVEEINLIQELIAQEVKEDCKIILGITWDDSHGDEFHVTIVSTGLSCEEDDTVEILKLPKKEEPTKGKSSSNLVRIDSKALEAFEEEIDMPTFMRLNKNLKVRKCS